MREIGKGVGIKKLKLKRMEKRGNEQQSKVRLMNEKEREVSLLIFENSLDGRDVRELEKR